MEVMTNQTNWPAIDEINGAQLNADFCVSLARLGWFYARLEAHLERSPATVLAEPEPVFALLDELYAEIKKSVAGFNDDPVHAKAKENHMAAFRASVGKYVRQAPFTEHAIRRPRGYAGDFEMMEMIYDSNVRADTAFGSLLQAHFMSRPGPESVRSRRSHLLRVL
jgi:hypothetical protein